MKILMAEHTFINSDIKVGCHHLAEEFSQENEVLYISTPISPFHFLKNDREDLYKKYEVYKENGYSHHKNLLEYIPMTISPIYNKFPFNTKYFCNNTMRFTAPSIKKIIKRLGFCSVDILIISTPYFHELIDFIDYKYCIYRITDDYSKFNHLPSYITSLEEKLVRKVDKVIVTSKPLQKKFSRIRDIKDIVYINNGVNLNNFIRDDYKTPSEYINDSNKKVIYMGALENWFDKELLIKCAEKNKNVSFYIIGKDKINLKELSYLKNIKILGARSYSEIPNYLYFANVGIIPFIKNDLINSVSPIKLYEYASLGLPIVSTNWDELSNIKEDSIYKANNTNEFLEYLNIALNKDKDEKLKIFSRKNNWRSKSKEIIDLYKNSYNLK